MIMKHLKLPFLTKVIFSQIANSKNKNFQEKKKMSSNNSGGHYWGGAPGQTQNQGNMLGDRPCVRQSKINREHMGGNNMKDILGQEQLKWDTNKQEGVYAGRGVWSQEGGANANSNNKNQPPPPPQQQQQ